MFVGYQGENPCFIAEAREQLEQMPCVVLSSIREVEFAQMFQGKIYLTEVSFIEAKSNSMRSIRNSYLEKYIDPIVSNPLRWAGMSEGEKEPYLSYRQYLLDYTNQENWWQERPKTFEEYV